MSDVALEAHEHTEHAEHAAHEKDPFVSRVSITIALLAVVAAVTSSLEAVEAGSAIIEANKAVLAQDKATDKWAYYQAKTIKKHIYAAAADQLSGAKADADRKIAQREDVEGRQVQAEATQLEAERDKLVDESQAHETRHHHLTIAATLLEIGIAISTIAIIARNRWMWIGAGALGVAGALVAALSFAL